MTTTEGLSQNLDDKYLRVLHVCLDYASQSDTGIFAGEWIKEECERQGIPFHQGWLTKLANLGILRKDDGSRGGHRRYYAIADAELAKEALAVQN